MAIVERVRSNGRKAFYIVKTVNGKRAWIPAGNERQEAERLERRVDKEIAEGTFRGHRPDSSVTFKEYALNWLRARKNRTADTEASLLKIHVLPREWFSTVQMGDLRPRDAITLVEQMKSSISEHTGKPLSHKSISNIIGILSTLFRDALIDEVISKQIMVLPRGLIRRSARRNARQPYTADEASRLLGCESADPSWKVFAAIALMTGMREGEICGRKWRDYDDRSAPLHCLSVDTQYDGQPLKTEWGAKGEHARKVPIHPELASLIEWWRVSGFETTHGRPPTSDDFIVPRGPNWISDGKLVCNTRDSGYKLWRKLCEAAKVENRTLHSTRHTFITLCRRGGANTDVLEKITHNSGGTIIDQYTHRSWSELCAVVMCLDIARLAQQQPLTRQQENHGSTTPAVYAPGSAPSGSIPFHTIPRSYDGDSVEYGAQAFSSTYVVDAPRSSASVARVNGSSGLWSDDANPMVQALLRLRGESL